MRGLGLVLLAFGLAGLAATSARAEPTREPDEPEPEPGPGEEPMDDPGPSFQPDTWLAELDEQLRAAGVTDFTAREFARLRKVKSPPYPSPYYEPIPRGLWPNVIGVARLAQRVRDVYGGPLSVGNGYRPAWYNAAVGGAKDSDHLYAGGVDLDVPSSSRSPSSVRRLEDAAAEVWLSDPSAKGFGVYKGGRVHLGVMGKRRTWERAREVLARIEG